MKRTALFLIFFLCLSTKAQDMQKNCIKGGDYIQMANLDMENIETDSFSLAVFKITTYNTMLRCEEPSEEIEFF
jgi:hypothetical protein